MKKFLVLMLSVIAAFSAVIYLSACKKGGKSSGSSEEDVKITAGSDGLLYELTDDKSGYAVTGIGDCRYNKLIIPSTYNGLPVTEIKKLSTLNMDDIDVEDFFLTEEPACPWLYEVVIPDSVTSISDGAFFLCANIASITIGSSVTSIGTVGFYVAEVINKSALDIKAGSSDYGGVAMFAVNVKKSGESEVVQKDGYLFYTAGGVNYLINYVGKATELTLPDKYNGENYVIKDGAFLLRKSLTSVTIPDSVSSIGYGAFTYCGGLMSVTIGNGVTSIGDQAFIGCTGLKEINFKGTKAQWNAIEKDSWRLGSAIQTIHCTDGDITV